MPERPKIMVRVRPEHQSLVRDLAARLTTDSGFAATVAALLAGPSSSPGVTSAAETAALAARVARLEATLADVRQILTALVEELSGQRHTSPHPQSALGIVKVSEEAVG